MKKALIVREEFDGRTIGQIEAIHESEIADKLNGNHYNKMVKIEVPAELEGIPTNELKGVLVPVQSEKWIKDGQADVFEDPQDETFTYIQAIPAHWEVQKGDNFVTYDKEQRVGVEYSKMNTAVLTEMKDLFKTTKSDSATRTFLTLRSMSDRPENFAGKGILAMYNVLGFSAGDDLDTAAKVKDFADQVLMAADNYAVFSLLEIQKFQMAKAVIEAE